MKRGQSALEYLVTYGWAILAIVIIAAVLWYTGVFNPERFRGGKEGTGFSVFTYSDHVISTTNVTVVLGNSVGRAITVVAAGTQVNGVDCQDNLPQNVAPTGLVTITCSNSGGAVVTGPAGSGYDVGVSIAYTDSQSGLSHVDTGGRVRGKIE